MITLVHIVGVVRLQRVLVMQLPIPSLIGLRKHVAGNQFFQSVSSKFAIKFRQRFCNWRSLGIEGDEDQAMEDLRPDFGEPNVAAQFRDGCCFTHRRCADKLSVQSIYPVVVRTNETAGIEALAGRRRIDDAADQGVTAMLTNRR